MAINIKRMLANSLISLSDEKPLRKITVTDIITHAGTGRQTFYNHFKDKNDLIYWIFPVSYTHLDVYKRQAPWPANHWRRSGSSIRPVSR